MLRALSFGTHRTARGKPAQTFFCLGVFFPLIRNVFVTKTDCTLVDEQKDDGQVLWAPFLSSDLYLLLGTPMYTRVCERKLLPSRFFLPRLNEVCPPAGPHRARSYIAETYTPAVVCSFSALSHFLISYAQVPGKGRNMRTGGKCAAIIPAVRVFLFFYLRIPPKRIIQHAW